MCTYIQYVHNYTYTIMGERERANLVVQLARFLSPALSRCRHTVMFYVTLNKRNPVTFPNTPPNTRVRIIPLLNAASRKRYLHSQLRILRAMQPPVQTKFLLQHYISLLVLSQLHHFLPYITWIAPARQQWSPFC